VLEETGITTGPLLLAAAVDSIRHDDAGRIQFHYTIIDYCARWLHGDARAGSDVTEAVWASLDGLEPFDLWSEAHRVIAISRRLLAADAISPSVSGSP
jgi:8-oxo-dGTP diphosphatase